MDGGGRQEGPALSPLLVPSRFEEIAGWAGDDHAAALACFRISARRMAERPYTTKAMGIDSSHLANAGRAALALDPGDLGNGAAARAFFETNFTPFRVVPESGSGFVTAYYEPEVEASPVRTARFTYPLYRRPPDLIDIAEAPPAWDPEFRFARRTSDGPVEYHDRAAIEAGALTGLGLELAWIESPVDGFFIHIQGSARLTMTDGSVRRIAYAGKSGHPFTAIGRLLADEGHMARAAVTMATIRAWLDADPVRARAMMDRNRSFIFFAETSDADPALGPVAAASVPLSPGRSLAIDHRLHTFGTPVFVATHAPLEGQSRPFRRLMVAQDTGSAIVGPARGDLFIGSGEQAGAVAGAVRHAADFTILVPLPEPRP
jgi:membrane-bound lytic murein transglycosylase A